ncbi:uncharacterized protein BDV17DRAFT_251824 [Aspergillus undulatus]|uniref:uncharacterized protein n=1 Tax=Aspergillus undulatus TaxID=1810928 RepID=UPI003CCE22B7
MNAAGNCFQAWWPLVIFRVDDAPSFTQGMYPMIAVGTALAVWTTVLMWTDRHQAAQRAVQVLDGVACPFSGPHLDEGSSKNGAKGAVVSEM